MRRINPLRTLAFVTAGLVGAGLLAFQVTGTTTAAEQPLLKRDEDGSVLTVVTEEDDELGDDDLRLVADTTRSRSKVSRNTRRDHSRSGNRSGRDDSHSGRKVVDWTRDGGNNKLKQDRSAHHTNDRSRLNTRPSWNTRGDHSRSGNVSGRDDSWSGRKVKDWTQDGIGDQWRADWSQNRTNDFSRHNTR